MLGLGPLLPKKKKKKKRKREEEENEAPALLLDFAVSGSQEKKIKIRGDFEDSGILEEFRKIMEELVNKLEARIDARVSSLENKVTTMDASIAYMKKVQEKLMEKKSVEEKVKEVSASNKNGEEKMLDKSNIREDDEGSSRTPSWLRKEVKKDPEIFFVNLNEPDEDLAMKNLEEKLADPDFEDITSLQNKMVASSEETEDDNALQVIDPNRKAVTAVVKRVPKLAGSQKPPYLGNSTVKRIIPHAVPSVADYDPMEMVDPRKWATVEAVIKYLEERPIGSINVELLFWKKLTLPRELWPDTKFGWLGDDHIAAAMQMFRQRDTRVPSPYRNIIGFMNFWFVCSMYTDYKFYKPGKFLFSEPYMDEFYGNTPADAPTKKRWFYDIDNLYTVCNIGNVHWVGVDINFPKKRIYVYDSIPTCSEDEDIVRVVEPLRRMIPAILNVFVEQKDRKKSLAQFDVRRLSNAKNNIPST